MLIVCECLWLWECKSVCPREKFLAHMFFAAQLYAGFFDFGQHFCCICTIAFTASRRRNLATNSAKTYLTRLLNRFMLNIVEQFGEKQDHCFACSEGYHGWRSTAQTRFKMSLNRPCWIVALVMKRSEAPKYTCQDSEEGIGGAHEWIWTTWNGPRS